MREKRLLDERLTLSQIIPSRGAGNSAEITSTKSATKLGVRRSLLKVRSGRGRKQAIWCVYLQDELRMEFERLRKLLVKFKINT